MWRPDGDSSREENANSSVEKMAAMVKLHSNKGQAEKHKFYRVEEMAQIGDMSRYPHRRTLNPSTKKNISSWSSRFSPLFHFLSHPSIIYIILYPQWDPHIYK
jgi:hypothetical protein